MLANLSDDLKGLHVWLYSSTNTPVSVADAIPDATDLVFVFQDSSDPVEYAFNIPTGELIDKIAPPPYALPVQIISPYEYYYDISPYFDQATTLSDEQFDFMAWMPNTLLWAKVSTNSLIWYFKSGIYIYVLKDDGSYLLEWVGY